LVLFSTLIFFSPLLDADNLERMILEKGQHTTYRLEGNAQMSSSIPSLVDHPVLDLPSSQAHQMSNVSCLNSTHSELTGLDESTLPFNAEVLFPKYPSRLPPPDLLFSLIDVFFSCYLDAHRVIHRPTFQASLYLPPYSVGFPQISLLHAICAIAFTYASPSNFNHLSFKPSGSVTKREWLLLRLA
jgi:hypothetical protein